MVTSELCGRTFSDGAGRIFMADLEKYPEPHVLASLERCRKEVRGALTLADVIGRLEDGRPGPDEAWSMLPMSELDTAVWTDEMRYAFGFVSEMIEAGDRVAARMAFRENYMRRVSKARDLGLPVRWEQTLGHDVAAREPALLKAIEDGRIPGEIMPQIERSNVTKISQMVSRIGK